MHGTPHLASARDQTDSLRQGRISSVELVELLLKHHAAVNPDINAVVTLDAERARAEAVRADRHLARTGRPLGPLHGLPITVKDSLETVRMRTTSGSPTLAQHIPARDADAVARLREAGAVIMGKTNTPAYCADIQTSNALFGTTRNPFSPTRTAGGSSGGAAAAVSAGLSSLEVGSDLAGSLRLPAHYCGVYALRPSHGLISSRGHIPRPPGWLTSSDLMTLGPLARSAEDLELLLEVLAGPSPTDAPAWRLELPRPRFARLRDHRVGIWADDPGCRVDTATRALLERVGKLVRTAGAQVDDVSRPADLAESDRAFQALMFATSTASASDADFHGEVERAGKLAPDDASPYAFYLRSRTLRHRDWLIANEKREELRGRWADYFSRHDILITPAAPTAAVADQSSVPVPDRFITVDGERRDYWSQTTWANLTGLAGLPTAIVPAGATREGLPLGVQIVGPHLADRTVIAFAARLAELLPPPVVAPARGRP
ncbi:amidase [Streptomyces jumonjinensis]|uniref:amidase n=1 Tax=Streptomyces jumonjinensis TaxID=1945 RepID=UPI0037999065